jgi:hypothetical protein
MRTGIKEVVGWPVAGIWSLKANRGAQRCLSEVFARLASRASLAKARAECGRMGEECGSAWPGGESKT